jgi:hypothetical protein
MDQLRKRVQRGVNNVASKSWTIALPFENGLTETVELNG